MNNTTKAHLSAGGIDIRASLEALLEGIGDGVFALDGNLRFSVFNRAAEDSLGVRGQDAIGRRLHEIFPGAVGDDLERRCRSAPLQRRQGEFEAFSFGRADRTYEIRIFPFGEDIGVAVRDIGDRVRAERLRGLADALPVLISYVDRDWIFRFVNKPYEAWFGRPLDEIVGHAVAEMMDPESFAARRPYVARALSGETLTYEATFVRNGAVLHTEIVHVPHRDRNGEVLGMYSVVQDVTARKLAENALAESEERFRSIANSAPVPMWVSRLGGRREFINRAYQEFLGRSYEEALNFDWRHALHPEDLPRILREQQAGEGSLRPFVLEARYRGGDGKWHWLRSESQPRWGPGGDHIGFIGVAHDVTEARQAEQNLLEMNQTLESRIAERTHELSVTQALIATFFNHSSECHAVLIEEAEGRFRYEEANPAALRLYGKTRAEVIGRTVDQIFPPEVAAELVGHLTACTRQSAPYRYERAQGDSIVEAIATVAPREPGAARRLFVTAHDVTDRRRLEQQLRQSQKMEAVGQLTGGVAHDFNNLLTLVLGGLEGVGRQIADLPAPVAARIERYRDMAQQGAERAAALTSRLMSFSRQQTLAPQTVDANALVASLSDLLRRTLGETIDMETRLQPELWRIHADGNQLENALINLALNSRDAMPEGGRLVIETANVALAARDIAAFNETVAAGDYVVIRVTDSGAGMAPATRERAFDPFFTTKEVGKGTGLGLSQVYGFARQSQGFVRIDSEPGEGATVSIHLPRNEGAALVKPLPTPSGAVLPAGSETILLVEDDDALRAYGAQGLREMGYRVLEAVSGAAALGPVEGEERIDLLLTDIVMPGGLNGRQLADRATARRPGLKVVFMTGYAPDEVMRKGRLGAHEWLIEKPFSLAALAEKVRQALNG